MKNALLLLVIGIFLSTSTAFAQHIRVPDAPEPHANNFPIHVSDKLNNSEMMKKLMAGKTASSTQQKSMLVVDNEGDEKEFFVYNFTNDTFIPRNFRLIKKGALTQIWFEISEINNGHLDNAVADSMFKYLEEESNQFSFNPNKGIIELSNEYLGDPPNYDGDNLVDFLITDIKDGWSPSSNGGYTAGFFYGIDQFTDIEAQQQNGRSNERDILYIDSYPGIFSNGEADPTRTLGTLSHEYQHLIHYAYNSAGFSGELSFINEAQSNFASLLSGYFPHPAYSRYLNDTNVDLFSWDEGESVLRDYGRAASFASYMWDQLGFENSGALTQNPQSGRTGIETTFSNLEAPFTFDEFLVNWGVANLINDKELDGIIGYEHPFLSNQRVIVDFEDPNISSKTYPIENGAIDYIGFQQGENFEITVSTDNPATGEIRVVTKTENSIEVHSLNSGVTFSTPSGEVYDQLYVMMVNTATDGSAPLNFTVSVSGELSYNLSTLSTYSENPKFYWPVPYDNASGVGRYGFSNKYTAGFDALIHSLELFIVSGQGSEGEQIGVKGEGTLRIAAYTDQGGAPGEALAADSIDFSDIGTGWQTFNVTDWDVVFEQGETFHIVYELIVPTINRDVNSIPLRLDDGTGIQNVTHVVTAPDEFELMFTDTETGGQHGVWNNLILAEYVVTDTEKPGFTQPRKFELSQNYPNPFNPNTNINFNIPEATDVQLSVYNALGQKVATLVNSKMSAGSHSVSWNAQNMASGLYIYQIRAGDFTQTRKMVLMK